MNYEQENYYDQEIEFDYEGRSYQWRGDYTTTSWGENESEFSPAYGEFEVTIERTETLNYYDEDNECIVEVDQTASMLSIVENQIERNF